MSGRGYASGQTCIDDFDKAKIALHWFENNLEYNSLV